MHEELPTLSSDPDGIDPMHEHIRKLVSLPRDQLPIGVVCEVYELCDHALCEASYHAWVILQETQGTRRGSLVLSREQTGGTPGGAISVSSQWISPKTSLEPNGSPTFAPPRGLICMATPKTRLH